MMISMIDFSLDIVAKKNECYCQRVRVWTRDDLGGVLEFLDFSTNGIVIWESILHGYISSTSCFYKISW